MLTKNTLQKTIDMILGMESLEDVVHSLRQDIHKLLSGKVNIRDLIISKEWSKKTKNPTPHDSLAQKMTERNPGEAPQFGDRIQYIITESAGAKLCDRAEDPLYVLENGLAIDYVYYADSQLLNPLSNILATAMPEFTNEEIKDMLWPTCVDIPKRPSGKCAAGKAKRPRKNKKHDIVPSGNRLITSFFVSTQQTKTSTVKSNDELTDIEDICMRLEKECLACKRGDATATASCKNRDCSLLYERYTQKRRIKVVGHDMGDRSYFKVLGLQ